MNVPNIPPEACDPSHAKLIIIGLVIICSYLAKELYDARMGWKKRLDESLQRQEAKLDDAIRNHEICQRMLPKEYLTKSDFEKIFASHLDLRSREWNEHRADWKEFTTNFWRHKHTDNGDVERV